MTAAAPRIACLDLDTFFVSVERLFDPSLIGKPVVVGAVPDPVGRRPRGVVTAASYEVRALGVRSGMPIATAYRLAPQAIYLPTRHGVYGDYSQRVRQIAERFCPVVQTASIDEFFLDFTGCERLCQQSGAASRGESEDAAILRWVRELTAAIQAEEGLPASAGIATSRAVCKIASGLAKPAGVLLVPAGAEAAFLAPLPVRRYPGIGPVAERKLAALGITTLGQLAGYPVAALRRIFGAWAEGIRRGAIGEAAHEIGRDRPAFSEHDPEGCTVGSISNERTFREDVSDPHSIEAMLCSLCERVCWRARKRGVRARTVTLKLRYADFETLSRARSISPTNSELEIYPVVHELYEGARTRTLPVRLLGLALSKLGRFDGQLQLFGHQHERVHIAVDAIREKYGYEALRLAGGRRVRPTVGQSAPAATTARAVSSKAKGASA